MFVTLFKMIIKPIVIAVKVDRIISSAILELLSLSLVVTSCII